MTAAINLRQRSVGSNERAAARLAALLVLPGWLLIVAVFALPILGAVYLSFRNETLAQLHGPEVYWF